MCATADVPTTVAFASSTCETTGQHRLHIHGDGELHNHPHSEVHVRELAATIPDCVIGGDQETTFDADRIKAAGAPVLQINTGSGCHLDAALLRIALQTLNPSTGVVVIENVGNLACPVLFDLGEESRVVIMSATEGADKPLKLPPHLRHRDRARAEQGRPAALPRL